MSNKLASTYNQISDVFSRAQIKNAVESLDRYSDRLKLIDSIIDRRQQIRQANDLSKITKYAHIFKRMIQRYRDKKEDKISTQRLQMQMVMSMFTHQNKQSPKHKTAIQSRKNREIAVNRRDAMKLKPNGMIQLPPHLSEKQIHYKQQSSPQMQSQLQLPNRTSRFLSDYGGISKYKLTTQLSEKEKEIKSLESKIKQSFVLKTRVNLYQNNKEYEQYNKIFTKHRYNAPQRTNKMLSSLHSIKQMSEQEYQQYVEKVKSQLSQDESSFVSYTERKLNQLYNSSTMVQSGDHLTSSVKSQLVTINKEIIDLSNRKLFSIK